MSRPLPTTSSCLHRAARVIQFRSELAIAVVLALGVAAGAAARRVLPLSPGPSAVIASPDDDAARRRPDRPPSTPAGTIPARSAQVVH
jgi:hypothetical protein